GRGWGKPMERMVVPPAQPGSWEDVMHSASGANALYFADELRRLPAASEQRGHRAIGVVYSPERERLGNYVPTVLPERYDAFLHVDESHALHPLDLLEREAHEATETYPWGM
ncbi:MAG TPA: erythromycin esterase family protein, partial [Fimbriimonadaceae bacterium]|nr:erythromycin esterase family protein [Fimbriimonadaceae bacterium]